MLCLFTETVLKGKMRIDQVESSHLYLSKVAPSALGWCQYGPCVISDYYKMSWYGRYYKQVSVCIPVVIWKECIRKLTLNFLRFDWNFFFNGSFNLETWISPVSCSKSFVIENSLFEFQRFARSYFCPSGLTWFLRNKSCRWIFWNFPWMFSSIVSKKNNKKIGHHSRLRNAMGQSYLICACTGADHARYLSIARNIR